MGHRIAVLGDGMGGDVVIADDIEMPDDVEPGVGGAVVIFRTVGVNNGSGHGQTQDQPRPTPQAVIGFHPSMCGGWGGWR